MKKHFNKILASKKLSPIKQVLAAKGSGLQPLLRQAKGLKTINQRLAQLLPQPLPQHCAAAGIHQHTLVLVVDSPAWATKLRLLFPAITKGLQDIQVRSISLKIQPEHLPSQRPHRRHARMSQNTSNLLNQLAETVSDPKLKSALHRLAKHAPK